MICNDIPDLNEETFPLFAAKAYDRPNAIMSEFEEDCRRIKYLKRLFRKYKATGVLKERLILNHLIIIYNVFGAEAATRILFLKIAKEDYDILKTFLLFLSFMPDIVQAINNQDIRSSDISLDQTSVEKLRKI